MFVAALLLSRWQVGRYDGFVLGQNGRISTGYGT